MKLNQLITVAAILTASCFTGGSLYSQIPSSGLVAYWPMNGNYNDAGPNGIHGTNLSSTATTNKFGAVNSAMNYNNPVSVVAQYATHPVNSNVNFATGQNFTISFLFHINSPWLHNGGLYDNNLNYSGPGIYIWKPGANPNFQFNYRNGSVASTAITIGVWHHAAFVRNAGTLSIYINGLLNASGPEGTQTPVYNFPARFGTMFFDGLTPPQYNGLHGSLDEFRIYNRALSVAEIAQMASAILPLKLGNFSAIQTQAGVRLNWETLSEQNTSHFEIERSADGIDFRKTGEVTAAGNSANQRTYTFHDFQPLPGINYYRLKMVDVNQIFTYSRVVAIKNDASLITMQLFPNPVTDILQVQIPSNRAVTSNIRIADAAGKLVYSKSVQLSNGNNAVSIPVLYLLPAVYYLVADDGEKRQTLPFIKK